jgi:hypothetical protein
LRTSSEFEKVFEYMRRLIKLAPRQVDRKLETQAADKFTFGFNVVVAGLP